MSSDGYCGAPRFFGLTGPAGGSRRVQDTAIAARLGDRFGHPDRSDLRIDDRAEKRRTRLLGFSCAR
jgi:hypothetical protein